MKILVCDDERTRGEKTRKAIATGTDHETRLLAGDELTKQIRSLFDRAASTLTHNSSMASTRSEFENEEYDIAILDNNLSELDIRTARHTAESIAGYVRAFWKIPYIVSLNKNPHVDFDLRYLVGDYQTHADLALNDKHLSISTLWTGISANDPVPALVLASDGRRRAPTPTADRVRQGAPRRFDPEHARLAQVGYGPPVATRPRSAVPRSAIGATSHVPEVLRRILSVFADSTGTRATSQVDNVEGRPAVRHCVPRRCWRTGPLDSPQPYRPARRAGRSSASPDAHALPSRSKRASSAGMERCRRRD